jgi:hypothetical protein
MDEKLTNQEAIEDLLDKFDFNKVQKAMEVLNWKWSSAEYGIPSIYELRKTARRLLKDAYENGVTEVSTGGFSAKYDGNSKEKWLYLEFKLTFASTFYTN